jgi:WD40 repeat protein
MVGAHIAALPRPHGLGTEDYTDCVQRTKAASGQLLATLQGHTKCVLSAEFSPDGQRIVTASDDKTARVLRVVTLSQLAELLAK